MAIAGMNRFELSNAQGGPPSVLKIVKPPTSFSSFARSIIIWSQYHERVAVGLSSQGSFFTSCAQSIDPWTLISL
jgi:hypothetical protein